MVDSKDGGAWMPIGGEVCAGCYRLGLRYNNRLPDSTVYAVLHAGGLFLEVRICQGKRRMQRRSTS